MAAPEKELRVDEIPYGWSPENWARYCRHMVESTRVGNRAATAEWIQRAEHAERVASTNRRV